MTRALALSAALLLGLCACGSHQAPTPRAPAAASPPAAPAPSGAATSSTGSAATAGTSSDHSAGTATGAPDAQGPLALPASTQWKPGTNYDVISPAQPTNAPPGKVQVMEVFWLACPHCYHLEPYMLAWRKSKADYIQFVRVPVMWGPVQQAHARLFYTLESLNRDDLVEKAFDTIHRLEDQTRSESIMIGSSRAATMRMQEAFATRNGISAADFANAYDSFDVNTKLQQAEQITQTYEIQSVPTIIVDGRYLTNPDKAGGERQLISLVDFLAKWVHDHRSAP